MRMSVLAASQYQRAHSSDNNNGENDENGYNKNKKETSRENRNYNNDNDEDDDNNVLNPSNALQQAVTAFVKSSKTKGK